MSVSSQTMDISADSWNMVYAPLLVASGWLSSKGVKLASSLMEVIRMCNIDPTLYGRIMLEQKQAKRLYDIKRMEIAFEKYKKRIKMIEEQEHADKKGELKDGKRR